MTVPATHGQRDPVALALRSAEVGGILLGVLVIGILHLVPPTSGIDPFTVTISEYGRSPLAAAFVAAIVLIAAGSTATLVLLVRGRECRAWSIPSLGLALWVAGMICVAVFQKADWAAGATATGYVHRAASVVAFVSLPIAILVLAASRARRRHARADARVFAVAVWITIALLASMALLGLFIGTAELRGIPWWTMLPIGLAERLVVIVELVALALVIAALRRGAVARVEETPNRP